MTRDRVSLALWSSGPGAATPEFVEVDGMLVAVVVVWPTDEQGLLHNADLTDARVVPWCLSEAVFERLERIHATWHLASHDLSVQGWPEPVVSPCPRSILQLGGAQLDALRDRAQVLQQDLVEGRIPVHRVA